MSGRCAIIPDDILKKIEENAPTIEQRNAARRSLRLSQMLRDRRAEAIEPGEGEKREVYDSKNTSTQGELARSEDQPETDDDGVDRLYDDAGLWYSTLYRNFGRRSFDGQGATLKSVAHFERQFDNAYWDGSGIWVGDGFFFRPFYLSTVVTFHEWTHALTERTTGLIYSGQPGALNEFVSDAVACAFEQWAQGRSPTVADWLVGRELFGTLSGRGLRDMLNPGTAYNDPLIGKDPQVAHMRDYYTGSKDNYGVHINSGIPNRAFALAAMKAAEEGLTLKTVVPLVMDVLFGRLVSRSAGFQEMANAMYGASITRYGADTLITDAVAEGWAAVGIEVGARPEPLPEPPPPSPCELSDADLLLLARHPALAEASPVLATAVAAGASDAEVLAMLRNPKVVEAAIAVAAMPQARRFMAVARSLRHR